MEENKIDPEIHKMAKTRKDLKIALIGFYTFNSKLEYYSLITVDKNRANYKALN
jgi:hypothetical protein